MKRPGFRRWVVTGGQDIHNICELAALFRGLIESSTGTDIPVTFNEMDLDLWGGRYFRPPSWELSQNYRVGLLAHPTNYPSYANRS